MAEVSEDDGDDSGNPLGISDSTATQIECIEDGCNSEVPVAIWDDELLAGRFEPQCYQCSQNVPEKGVWNVERIKETNPHKSSNAPDLSQIPEDKEWAVFDDYPSSPEEFQERHEHIGSDMYDPDKSRYMILIRDPENTEALESAREKIRELR